jgi:hypothetical protein
MPAGSLHKQIGLSQGSSPDPADTRNPVSPHRGFTLSVLPNDPLEPTPRLIRDAGIAFAQDRAPRAQQGHPTAQLALLMRGRPVSRDQGPTGLSSHDTTAHRNRAVRAATITSDPIEEFVVVCLISDSHNRGDVVEKS